MDIIELFNKSKLPTNEPLGYTYRTGSNILLSAPHAVSQLRDGVTKFAEVETYNLIEVVKELTGASIIAKTCNLGDDANFDETSSYRDKIADMIKQKKIKYILDIHNLNLKRSQTINLGTNNGLNLGGNFTLLKRIQQIFEKNNLETTEDYPFYAGARTISSYFAKNYNVFCLQIEINSRLYKNPQDVKNLVETLAEVVRCIASYDKLMS